MSRSNDPGHFFQTTSALNETARKASKSKNTKGNPVKLPSKVLALAADPHDGDAVYVAEAAGNVKRIKLQTGEVTSTYSGPLAPLTSVAVSGGSAPSESHTIFAGCWDKSIWSWDTASRRPGHRFQGHADFVKAVLVFSHQGKELLVSGSADATIIVWDVASGARLHTLKGHSRGILALALDPMESPSGSQVVFSAGTDREIRRWVVGIASASEIKDDGAPAPIIAHETGVDAIRFDADGDLWTASADRSAKCLSRGRSWAQDTSFEHPDYVRDVVVDEAGGWVITACRDEEVRVWDKGSGKLHHVFSGHYEEVTSLVLLGGQRVVSTSIDGTVRTWSLKAQDLVRAMQEAEDERLGKVKDDEAEKKEGLLTADEEAELAALMEDSE